jgi:predicted DNA-binding transcriptional regulator YafY
VGRGERLTPDIMDKISKILLIVNLLHHRRFVTLADIRSVCQVCDRSIYRYINTISAANIPVYFDKAVRGYRLANKGQLELSSLDANEALLISLGLCLLSAKAGAAYWKDIDTLARKVISSQDSPLADLWTTCKQRVTPDADGGNLSELITYLVVQLAVQQHRKLLVLPGNGDSEPKSVELKSPVLTFNERWLVQEKGMGLENAIPIAGIQKAKVV